jgi:high-affinity nickel permease
VTGLGIEIDGTLALLIGVLALGFRHGFDWDHIVAISDITSSTVTTDSLNPATDSAATPENRPRSRALAGPALTSQAAALDGGWNNAVIVAVGSGPIPSSSTRTLARWLPSSHAITLGTLYALGHASVVAALGLAAYLLSAVLPTWVDSVMGRIVGLTLLLMGFWLLFSAYRYVRHGHEFRLRSRWMLVFDGLSSVKARVLRRPPDPERGVRRSYGVGAAYGIGMIHGVGAETATQVLLITALGGAAGQQGLGVPLMFAFIIGLVAANTVIVVLSAAGFSGADDRRRLNLGLGVVAGLLSIAIGALFLLGWEAGLPDLTEMLGGSIEP